MATTETCSVDADNRTICYIHHHHHDDDDVGAHDGGDGTDGGGYFFAPYLHDAKLVLATLVISITFTMIYNFYLEWQVRQSSSSQNTKSKINAQERRLSVDSTSLRSSSKALITSMTSSTRTSMAASLADIEGISASGNFLSGILSQMWAHLDVAVGNCIKETLEPTLKELAVPMHFIRLVLGDVPIKTQNMFIHRPDLAPDKKGKKGVQAGIQIDVDVIWDGNCDIMLQATVNKSAKVTFGVKGIKLSGRMHILLSPLTTELPVISAVQYGFTNPPELQLSFTGAAGLVTNSLSFVQNALVGVVQSSLASMLVLPHRMVMPMDLGTYDYFDTYQPPVGMVRLTCVRGRGFKLLRKMILNDIPDIYCVVTLGASGAFRPPFRTTTKFNNLTPNWEDESCDFILYDMDQKVYVSAYDEDTSPMDPDDLMGKAEITARDLFRNEGTCELELHMDKKKTGCYVTVRADLFYLSNQLQSTTSPHYEGKNKLCGLATIIVTRAFDVPVPKADAATYIKVTYGEGCKHKKVFMTGTVSDYPGIDALNPMYDSVFHVPITSEMLKSQQPQSSPNNKSSRKPTISSNAPINNLRTSITRSNSSCSKDDNDIVFTLIDTYGANGTSPNGELGRIVVTHDELRRTYEHTITATRPIGDGGAKLEFRVSLKGMQSEDERLAWLNGGIPQAMTERQESMYSSLYDGLTKGVTIRVTAMRGRGFQITKRRIGKKDDVPDVYCMIRLNASDAKEDQYDLACWKTKTIKDDTMPAWNESRDFENIHPARDLLRVDVYDQNSGKDTYLGSAEYSMEKLIRKRLLEMELRNCNESSSSKKVGSLKAFITLQCIQVETSTEEMKGSEVVVHCHPDMGDEGFESTLVKNGMTSASIDDDNEDGEDGDVVTPLASESDHPSNSRHPSHIVTTTGNVSSSEDDDNLSICSTSSSSSMSRKMRKNFRKVAWTLTGNKSKKKK